MKRAKSEADTRSRHVGSAVRVLRQQDKLLSDVEDSQVQVKGYVWPYDTGQPQQQQPAAKYKAGNSSKIPTVACATSAVTLSRTSNGSTP